MTQGDIILAGVSTIIGIVIPVIYDQVKEHVKVNRELEANNYIDISGNWFAAWQTSVDHEQVINTEPITLKQHGCVVRIRNLEIAKENPKGGYLWSGTLHFFLGRELLGWYFAIPKENSTAKGMYFFYYDAPKKEFTGKWVGCSRDGLLMTGFGTIAGTRERALEMLHAVMAQHPLHSTIVTTVHE